MQLKLQTTGVLLLSVALVLVTLGLCKYRKMREGFVTEDKREVMEAIKTIAITAIEAIKEIAGKETVFAEDSGKLENILSELTNTNIDTTNIFELTNTTNVDTTKNDEQSRTQTESVTQVIGGTGQDPLVTGGGTPEVQLQSFTNMSGIKNTLLSDRVLKAALFASLFFLLNHKDMQPLFKKMVKNVPKSVNTLLHPAVVFGVLYYVLELFI